MPPSNAAFYYWLQGLGKMAFAYLHLGERERERERRLCMIFRYPQLTECGLPIAKYCEKKSELHGM